MFAGAALALGALVFSTLCAAPDSRRCSNGRVRGKSLVAYWCVWADFASLESDIKASIGYLQSLCNLNMQLFTRIVRASAVNQGLSLQRAEHELCPRFRGAWRHVVVRLCLR